MIEDAVAAIILAATAYLTGGSITEWVGAVAVFCTFGYTQIADRLQERQDKEKPSVECHKKMLLYFVSREVLWLVYFLLHHSYSALVGVGIFLFYPLWRKLWRKWHPLTKFIVLGNFNIPIPHEEPLE